MTTPTATVGLSHINNTMETKIELKGDNVGRNAEARCTCPIHSPHNLCVFFPSVLEYQDSVPWSVSKNHHVKE